MMRRHLGTIVFVLALAGASTACSNGGSNGGVSGGGGTPSTSGGGGATTIVAQNFAFSPDRISVPAGTVTLTVTNEDSAEHTFTLDDGTSNTDLPPGSTQTIDLDLSKTVGWHCTIHPSMTGTIEVK